MTTPRITPLRAADGVALVADYWPDATRALGCVVVHGFTGSARNPRVQGIAAQLNATGFGVLAPDLRGHGRTAGASTVGAEEVLDVAAAVARLRDEGYAAVAVLGWSMGGSAVLRYAGLGGDADAVVSASSPGHWYERGTRALRVVHWVCETHTGRLAVRLARRTRLSASGWSVLPQSPVELVGRIAPTPLLIVHGSADHYFPVRHAEILAAEAAGAQLWIEPGMGHAETATTPELTARIATWVHAALVRKSADRVDVCDDGARE